MPYYRWSGVDLRGRIKKGKQFAPDTQELSKILFMRDIALVRATAARIWRWQKITVHHKIALLRQLAQLIEAGMPLSAALFLVCQQFSYHPTFQIIIYDIAVRVQQGTSLHEALARYGYIFEYFIIQALLIGQESGTLQETFYYLCDYLTSSSLFEKKVRSALYVPLLTGILFCVIALGMIIFIVPKFAHFFHALKQDIPPLTRFLIGMSNVLTLRIIILSLFIVGTIAYIISAIIRGTQAGQYMYHRFLLHAPYICSIVQYYTISQIARTLSLLLRSGMRVVPALHVTIPVVHNIHWQHALERVQACVASGSSIGQALVQSHFMYWPEDVIAIVTVGQESGALDQALDSLSMTYSEKLQQSLDLVTRLIQPSLLIALGIGVAFLILAIYVPIMQISAHL